MKTINFTLNLKEFSDVASNDYVQSIIDEVNSVETERALTIENNNKVFDLATEYLSNIMNEFNKTLSLLGMEFDFVRNYSFVQKNHCVINAHLLSSHNLKLIHSFSLGLSFNSVYSNRLRCNVYSFESPKVTFKIKRTDDLFTSVEEILKENRETIKEFYRETKKDKENKQ